MKAILMNGYWFTNVGEAFVDIGGIQLIKNIFESVDIACISEMSSHYIKNAKFYQEPIMSRRMALKKILFNNYKDAQIEPENHFENADMSKFLFADYVIVPGLVGAIEFLKSPISEMVLNLSRKGVKTVFLGLGCNYYNDKESVEFSKYLEEVKPALVISRDDYVYEKFKDIAPCIRGIDCAFWTIDAFNPKGFSDTSYDVVAFNRSEEPKLWDNWDKPIVRPWHMQYSFTKNIQKEGMMISDTPYDYLTVYANANSVYTDLVHASIVSMMYGTPVKYWYIDERSKAFQAIDKIKIDNGWMSVSHADLKKQKDCIVSKAKMYLNIYK